MTLAPPWVVPVVGTVVAIALIGGAYGWARHQGVAAEKPKTEAAADAGAAANLNTEGAEAAGDAVSAIAGVDRRLQEINHALDLEAARDAAADAPLPAGVVDRIRRGDERVCSSVPALCAEPSAAGEGGGGNPAPNRAS
ncbi:hypothetical protein [Caulobacter sp. UNC279MFTsu5.1]|uniref:hypothetical protein n=1 Tax=Caulobacter sp. UNC279MFTsu5.1 TaxID=1502775 RepID=UPI0008E5F533|nr:hypothetical protein [Caulobacter sp. UNC279MFTsu5.1]SFK41208.1 hypothetical protein SAMN02799626_04218 [Caulobacter sp. UNC279MFTsu5.1]